MEEQRTLEDTFLSRWPIVCPPSVSYSSPLTIRILTNNLSSHSEKYQHYYALAMRKSYEIFIVIPRWLVLILSGVVAQFFMKILHRNPAAEVSMTREEERRLKSKEAKEAKLKLEKEAKDDEGKDEVKASGSTPSKGKAKSRRGGKK